MGSYAENCVVVEGERIIHVGREESCRKYSGKASRIIDLGGSVLIPGLIDAHLHLSWLALGLDWLDLRGTRSISELVEAIRLKSTRVGKGEWIIGRGWDHELFYEKRLPTRWDIDEASPNNPVFLIRVCGHVGVVNSVALEKTGLKERLKEYKSFVEFNDSGEPTGILYEDALKLVYDSIPKPSVEELAGRLRRVLLHLASYGLTTVHSMNASLEEFNALRLLEEKKELPIRVKLFLSREAYERIDKKLLARYRENPMLSIKGVKIFMDGSFGAKTAALKEPYSDDELNRGKLLLKAEEVASLASELRRNGLLLAVHAIGDRALEEVIKALSMVPPDNIRIEHASLTPPEIIDKLAKYKPLAIVVQPHFTISDWWIEQRLGERTRHVYAFKSLMSKGLVLAGSSDAPVEPVNPWLSIAAAIHRGKLSSITGSESLPASRALSLYTIGGAIAGRDEGEIGLIKRGYFADLIALDENPWSLSEYDIAGIRPRLVMVGGRIIYEY